MKKYLLVIISVLLTSVYIFADTGVWQKEYATTNAGDGYTLYICGTFSYAFGITDKFSAFGFSAPYDVFDLDENNMAHVLITQYNNCGDVVKQDFIEMELTQPEQNMLFCFDKELSEEIKSRLFNGGGSISICTSDIVDNTIYLRVNAYKTPKSKHTSKSNTTKRKRK